MSSKSEKDRQKAIQDKCQQLLNEMLRDEDNKYCVDCDAKGPRWASWNLGIFLCIRCAGIHRNLGVHISKVKSVNLDTWTPEQVVSLQNMGNSRARAVYEANLPDNFRRPQTDSPLEAFVRAKYEQKKYIAREWVPPTIGKVNWDKEIEEEEQARRRRKESKSGTPQLARTLTSSPGGHSMTSEIPAPLPKPKSSASPKPSRTLGSSSASPAPSTNIISSSATLDLLGLDTPTGSSSSPSKGDDIFSGFLSAPPVAGSSAALSTTQAPEPLQNETAANLADSKRSAEENSFFNQPAATAQEKKQLTKDSILALYSSVPTSATPPAQAQAPQQFGVFPSQGIAGFGSVPPTGMGLNYPMSNGMMMPPAPNGSQNGMFGSSVGQSGLVNSGSGIPQMTSNPFFNMTSIPTNSVPVQNPMNQLPQQMNMLNLSGAPGVGIPQQGFGAGSTGGNPWANPSQPMTMPQSSIPQSQTALGHTLATNLWQ
ncbi:stromal membrane-associated protein 1 [Frankliniella occidentalis]|uniref:Stromal membrane-associated protein 1 n=1 Tax=Frankliniella occidentalis TaxID=133901 RepID=A0A6J1SJG2_FRAOC|nr:stromal membrane-associated protein 1 [Frankliniella occidentalis]XP_052120127.1 stromal membrane-associated protein 1 [Frankliniella occidentalis]